jgi:hypothetical protein
MMWSAMRGFDLSLALGVFLLTTSIVAKYGRSP